MGSDLAAMTFLGPIGMAVVWRGKKKKKAGDLPKSLLSLACGLQEACREG